MSWQSVPIRWMARLGMGLLSARSSLEGWRQMASLGAGWNAARGGVQTGLVSAGGVPAEWLVPAGAAEQPVILYFHGGGWILGWYHSHRRMTARIAQACGMRLLAVDYRLAPEHPFPAALDDCLAAYRFLLEGGCLPGQIALAGDSAGANLVLAVLLALKQAGEPLPAAGVCLSPAVDLARRGESYTRNARKEALLPLQFVNACVECYLGGQDPHNPLISPVFGDLAGLPPLLIQAGGDELLLSDAERITALASQAEVEVTLQVWQGMWHVWQAFAPYLPEANAAIAEIAAFLRLRLPPVRQAGAGTAQPATHREGR